MRVYYFRTHCYVRYMRVEDAYKAVNTLNSVEIRPGKPILLKKYEFVNLKNLNFK